MNLRWVLASSLMMGFGCGGDNATVDAGPVTLTFLTGRGVATSNPAGIHCGKCYGPPPDGPLLCADTTQFTECSADFALGTTVEITLTESAYQVINCGGEIVSGNVCTVTMDGPKTFSINGSSALQ